MKQPEFLLLNRACQWWRIRVFSALLLLVFFHSQDAYSQDQNIQSLLDNGWQALVVDNDTLALRYFGMALSESRKKNDIRHIGESLLNLGICTYGSSYSKGMEYATQAMAEYSKLEKDQPDQAHEGRSRCLQLISTIYGRQGKNKEALALSREAMIGLENDTTGTLGLVYSTLGECYLRLGSKDSSEYYFKQALNEHIKARNNTYLPASYRKVGDLELAQNKKEESRSYYDKALAIADSTNNRQARISSLLALGKWSIKFESDYDQAEIFYRKALAISREISDKLFYIRTLEALIALKKQKNDFKTALQYDEEITAIRDSVYNLEKERIVKNLEVQFDVSEKERLLRLEQKEKQVIRLTNYLLWGGIALLLFISLGIISFLRRINKRDKLLLQTKEKLVEALEDQRKMKEQQIMNELEFKESQLSALTLQMLQKNKLMQELKDKIDRDQRQNNQDLNKIINQGLNHDQEWSDFNTYFESLNKNFYTKLKQTFPEISPNDMKICALIKLNLSMKEMAGILNISPDSVKTARYRLRKKLHLNTEDNLTDFILSL